MKKIKVRNILLIVLAAVVVIAALNWHLVWTLGCNWFGEKIDVPKEDSWDKGTSLRVSYGNHEAQYIDLYLPDGVENAPLYVIVHGGGFVTNDAQSKQAVLMYRYFRDHGFACASVNYRLAKDAPFPAACEDVSAAVRYLVKESETYGYNADKIAIFGESAGGYLATREALTETGANIAALVSYYGVYNFDSMSDDFKKQGIPSFILNMANGWANNWIEGDFNSCEEYWVRKNKQDWTEQDRNSYSVQYIAEHDPANQDLTAYFMVGNADITVPFAQTLNMAEAFKKEYGEDKVSLTLLNGAGHAADRMYNDKQLADVEAFLRKVLGLK